MASQKLSVFMRLTRCCLLRCFQRRLYAPVIGYLPVSSITMYDVVYRSAAARSIMLYRLHERFGISGGMVACAVCPHCAGLRRCSTFTLSQSTTPFLSNYSAALALYGLWYRVERLSDRLRPLFAFLCSFWRARERYLGAHHHAKHKQANCCYSGYRLFHFTPPWAWLSRSYVCSHLKLPRKRAAHKRMGKRAHRGAQQRTWQDICCEYGKSAELRPAGGTGCGTLRVP